MPKRKLQEALDEAGEEAPEQISDTNSSSRCLGSQDPHQPEPNLFPAPPGLECAPSTSSSNAVCTLLNDNTTPKPAKQRKSVRFSDVTVYLFPRQQGFTCVPSSGGTTLGMTREHSAVQNFTLTEHEQECRTNRTQLNLLRKRQLEVSDSDEEEMEEDIDGEEEEEDDDEEDEEEDEEVEDEYEETEDACNFPIAIPIRQRRSLLKDAGCEVDLTERQDCQYIRTSREACGCQCQTVCNPDECSCSLNKIKCQVDRYSYPCGCTKDGCRNDAGRVEFNPARVKTHYISTISRLNSSTNMPEATVSGAENHLVYQNYVQYESPGLPVNNSHMEVYSSLESYSQAPQCDYAYTSLSSSSSNAPSSPYRMQALNVSVSMSVESYSSTVCQPAYDYYSMQSAPYEINSSSIPTISPAVSTPALCSNGGGYLCMDMGNCYCNSPANQTISPHLEYSGPAEELYPTALPPVTYAHLTSSSHAESNGHNYASSPSDGSGDSSGSEQPAGTLDFGELIKQSLVETVTA